MSAHVAYSESGQWITHPCQEMKLNNDQEPEYIDFHFDVRHGTKEWLLSEYEDFGNYYIIRFCPWCGEKLPKESEIDPALLDKVRSVGQ